MITLFSHGKHDKPAPDDELVTSGSGTAQLSVAAVENDFVAGVYEKLASVYDLAFGPALQPGSLLNQVQIELDADTQFRVDLKLHHVTSPGPDAKGVRLGCEFIRADPGALRSLQRYIDQTQKRGKMLSLG